MDSSLIVFYLFFLVGVYTSADEDKRCERPEQMSYGHFVIVNVTEFAHGTTIKYICGPGYRMESLVDTRTCSGGRWDTPLPACEEITCKQQEPKHVRIVAGTPSTFPPFKVKHSLSFQCSSSELIMTGPSTITCGDDGEWSSPFPTCSDKSKCDPPPVIEFADLMVPPNSEYQLNERVEYFCRRFYTMSSGSVMTCGKGRWIGEVKCLSTYKNTTFGEQNDRKCIYEFYLNNYCTFSTSFNV
ncbi:P-selectin-like isoform X1 [Silurus meridionalis]|uniref:P-selectin-like isoform X1 n=1 Tax=Silurus meridionalis TaxID=175797 RepID=UPI001EEA0887|nr:P-selectin-like isoform X1 [Silurus meridionalis]